YLENFPPVLVCPEAAMVWPHPVSYATNMIALPDPSSDCDWGVVPSRLNKPATLGLLRPQCILIHDTAIQPDWEDSVGFLGNYDIDKQRFWKGALFPQYRYFDPNDRYARLASGLFGNNKPVQWDSTWTNIDPPANTHYYWQGNLRFRHGSNKLSNCGYGDGHVEPVAQKDVLRHHFMIKWPPAMPRNAGAP
ncbi:MAG: hypothetical protein ACREJC_11220, partial [Tepidisphaeraceae bacterium]